MPEQSIILELQHLALSKTGDPTELLRKALLVATKLRLEDFRIWVAQELNGYPDDNVPAYREVRCELRLRNPYQGLIPIFFEDDRIAEILCNVRLSTAISSIHDLLNQSGDDKLLTIPFTPNQESFLLENQDRIGPLPPVRLLGRGQLARIVDAVYNTVLEWALKLEAEGILGEGLSFSASEKQKASSSSEIRIQHFQGVLGNVSNSTVTQQLEMQVTKGDLRSLVKHLRAIGVSENETNELDEAIGSDPAPKNKTSLGPKTTAWLGRVILRLESGAGAVASHASGALLAEAIWKYFGV